MHPGGDFLDTPELNHEGWRDALHPQWGGITQRLSNTQPLQVEPIMSARLASADHGLDLKNSSNSAAGSGLA
jgi:hypothetical protein